MTESDFEYLIRNLSEARSRATELTVAVRAQAGAGRLADLGTSAVSNIEKLFREVRVLAFDQPQQAKPVESVAAAPPAAALAPEHWLHSFIKDLSASSETLGEVSFENVERLLQKYKQTFLEDLETARRMYRVYPHLFRAGNSRRAGAS